MIYSERYIGSFPGEVAVPLVILHFMNINHSKAIDTVLELWIDVECMKRHTSFVTEF